ncbi:hypothetical protein [Desertivirga brevis]|uniref:hypothetical protein n=1 Tax=Desertivirga brevis TaxID=2810310 RepID=UPI001A95E33D|nr:hypothetical protein [Pedobacter sp. SYSU D00873]
MKVANSEKRVVVVIWKNKQETEVFSNLKNFCLSYPQYNYNTLSNYLSKEKIAYENDFVKVERKVIVSKVKPQSQVVKVRAIAPVVRKVALKDANDDENDLRYWLSRPVQERAAATTFLVMQMLKKGQRMDKTVVNKIKPMS